MLLLVLEPTTKPFERIQNLLGRISNIEYAFASPITNPISNSKI